MRIAVDVMGGDHGSRVVIDGIKEALSAEPAVSEVHLVGNQPEIQAALRDAALQDPRVHVIHASEVLTMEDKPVEGLRRKKDCSILRAVDLVRDGRAQAVISTGNTGGILAAATIRLRTLEGVERPAIGAVMPSRSGSWVLIDAGANPESTPANLMQNAIMGCVYAREVLGIAHPRVGVLSNGAEEIKGTDLTRETLKLCRPLPFHFLGFVEGHDLFGDTVDVVVTDGFVGNIVLKSCEALGMTVISLLRDELTANPLRRLGALLSAAGLRSLKRRMDPQTYGGAPMLGLNGVVFKVHGSARVQAVRNAVLQVVQALRLRVNDAIIREVAAAQKLIGTAQAA
jgi:glycerol-3-phosphate acyltransferase PlsX